MYDTDLLQFGLEIVCDNAYELATKNKDAFIQLRRMGLGASDSSIYLGVNKFTTIDELISQKLSNEVTDVEREIGEKEVVRKGTDLEPIILQKFKEWCGFDVYKPAAMYRISAHPQLTINFDGIINLSDVFIPVEAKFVSVYANKYWDRSKCIKALHEGSRKASGGIGIVQHIEQLAEAYGIPPYYFTQVQQQLIGLNAQFAYLVALFDKGWELGVFKIYKDDFTCQALLEESANVWKTIEEKKKH